MVMTPIWRDNADTPLGTMSFTKRIDVNVLEGPPIIHAKMRWQVLYSRNYAKNIGLRIVEQKLQMENCRKIYIICTIFSSF